MSWTLIYLLAFAFSLALTAYIIPKILVISFKKKLFDVVDARKVHTGYVPRLGGVSFTPTIIITSCLLVGLNIIFGAKHSMAFAYWAPEVIAEEKDGAEQGEKQQRRKMDAKQIT